MSARFRRRPRPAPDRHPWLTALLRKVDASVPSRGPVVVGPWTGEVGYELLYWIPFVRWVASQRPELRSRLVAVSRGGVGSWYEDFAGDYVDIFTLASPAEVAERRYREAGSPETTKRDRRAALGRKQRTGTELDRWLARAACERIGASEYGILHPSLGYRVISLLKKTVVAPRCFSPAEEVLRAARVRAPALPQIDLPDGFVAARFYGGGGSPDTERNRAVAAAVVEALAAVRPVVLLDPGIELDKHSDFELAGDNLVGLPRLAPETNLAVQTAVLARADLFVGSYGGLSYLPPLLGVPSLALLLQEPTGKSAGEFHLLMARRLLASSSDFGSFTVLDPGTLKHADAVAATASAVARVTVGF